MRCSASEPRAPRSSWPTSTASCATPARVPATSRASRSASGRAASPASASAWRAARALSFALDVPVAGVSTLAALAAGSPGAAPVVDARRGQVFTLVDGRPACIAPQELRLRAGSACVGDGAEHAARRSRPWAPSPPDGDEAHLARARFHAALAAGFGPAEQAEPASFEVARRRPAAVTVEIRKLSTVDLGEVDRIERLSYPTPWSRSMFAGEMAKLSSLCLGAFDSDRDRLVGYLIVSRYVDAWHVMNVAVDPTTAGAVARLLLEHVFELTADDGRRGTPWRCASPTPRRSGCTSGWGSSPGGVRRGYYTDNREDARSCGRTPCCSASASSAEPPP